MNFDQFPSGIPSRSPDPTQICGQIAKIDENCSKNLEKLEKLYFSKFVHTQF